MQALRARYQRLNRPVKFALFIGLFAFCCCCSVLAFAANSPRASNTPVAQVTVQTENTKPAVTQAPTNTPPPSNTPRPASTPRPTNPPQPTHTPTAPPTPVVLTGRGDSVIEFDIAFCPCVAHVVGNSGSRFFAVTAYNASGDAVDLLVNTTDPYDGYRPVNWSSRDNASRFQVEGNGDWTITLIPLGIYDRTMTAPGTYTGTGDDIVVVTGRSSTAQITGNTNERYFGVTGYDSSGSIDILVNTTDVYDGTVILASDTIVLEVRAEGEWAIEIK